MKPAIRVENLSKVYRINRNGGGGGDLREALGNLVRGPLHRLRNGAAHSMHTEEFWALKDVSFEVQPGEVLGVIGRNGAGKSTLLKILSQIMEPSSGRAEIRGRVGSLLEVGTGFHEELTGRENVYLNGSILGMSRREIDRKFDEIVDFSGVEKFLDTPVKRYSSGMKVRLGFAVAAHLEPEILIVDEVLAVGDAEFQRRCLGKMSDVAESGRTVLFVSHTMPAVQHLCDRAILLSSGRIQLDGPTAAAVAAYLEVRQPGEADGEVDLECHPKRRAGCTPLLRSVRLLDEKGRLCSTFSHSDSAVIQLSFRGTYAPISPHFGIGCNDGSGNRIFSVATYLADTPPAGEHASLIAECRITFPSLAPGHYTLSLSAGTRAEPLMDALDNAISFEIAADNFYGNGEPPRRSLGSVLVRSKWTYRDEGPLVDQCVAAGEYTESHQ